MSKMTRKKQMPTYSSGLVLQRLQPKPPARGGLMLCGREGVFKRRRVDFRGLTLPVWRVSPVWRAKLLGPCAEPTFVGGGRRVP